MSVDQSRPSPFPDTGWDFRNDDPAPARPPRGGQAVVEQPSAGDNAPAPAAWTPPSIEDRMRALTTREVRLVGMHSDLVCLTVVESAHPLTGWQARSRIVLMYHMPRARFLADPDAALRPALQALIEPMLDDRAGEGEGL